MVSIRRPAAAHPAGEGVLQRLGVVGMHDLEQGLHPVAQRAVLELHELVQAGREISDAGDEVPVPEPVIGAARGHLVALFAEAELLAGPRPVDGPGDERGRRLQHLDLQRGPDALDLAVVEAEKTPELPARHDRHGGEGQRPMLEEDLARIAAHLPERRLNHFAALPAARPFAQLP